MSGQEDTTEKVGVGAGLVLPLALVLALARKDDPNPACTNSRFKA
jgi:cyanate permease